MHPFRTSARPVLLLLSALLLPPPQPAAGQIRASERSTVTQTVDGTIIALDYARPRARGRADLFGGEVHWGEVWTPGANEATVLELNKDVEIQGHTISAGRWSMWLVVAEEGPWELVLDPRDTLFHTERPEVEEDQIRFPVETGRGPFVEVLTWSFPAVENDGTTMLLAWGERRVPLEVKVPSSRVMVMDADVARQYVGDWTITFQFVPPDGEPSPPAPFNIRHLEDGRLVVETVYDGPEPEPMEGLLMPLADGIFEMAITGEGDMLEMVGLFVEFDLQEGRPTGFNIRFGESDEIVVTGERTR